MSFDGSVKLADFGTARAVAAQPTLVARVGSSGDVFALGVVLWEMLCGRPLLEGERVPTPEALEGQPVMPPAWVNPLVPTELSDAVMRALSSPADDHFPTALELEAALTAVVRRHARSLDDTSVATFMTRLFKVQTDAGASTSSMPSEPYQAPSSPSGDRDYPEVEIDLSTLTPVPRALAKAPAFRAWHLWLLGVLAVVGALAGVLGMSWFRGQPPPRSIATEVIHAPVPVAPAEVSQVQAPSAETPPEVKAPKPIVNPPAHPSRKKRAPVDLFGDPP